MTDTRKPTKEKATPKKKPLVLPKMNPTFYTKVTERNPQTGILSETFAGIPMDSNTPFIEIKFDRMNKRLGILSKNIVEKFEWVPRIDTNGYPEKNKSKANPENPIAMQRIVMNSPYEYFIEDEASIEQFITCTIVNEDFDWRAFFAEK